MDALNFRLETKNKVDLLLVVRGLACFLVVLSHVVLDYAPDVRLISAFGYDLTWMIRTTGALGVWLFFILSGYLMGKGFYTGRYQPTFQGSLAFYRNRFLRIYPLYVVSIFVVWAMAIHIYPVNADNLKTLFHLLCFSYYQETFFPNSLLWTISTEFRFYLLVPLVFLLTRYFVKDAKSFVLSMISVVVIWIAYRFQLYETFRGEHDFSSQWIHKAYIPLNTNLDLFLSGFLLNFAVQRRRLGLAVSALTAKIKKGGAIALFVLMILMQNFVSCKAILFAAPFYTPAYYVLMPTLVILATCFLIYQFETKSQYVVPSVTLSHIRQNPLRLFELFGVLTYGIYLWHLPILKSFSYWKIDRFLGSEPDTTLFAVRLLYTLSLSVGVSALTYIVIEKQFETIKSRGYGLRR